MDDPTRRDNTTDMADATDAPAAAADATDTPAADVTDAADETTISWRVARPGTPVFGPTGDRIATLRDVSADENEDIFHGLVVDRGGAEPLILVPRDDVTAIEADRIDVALDADALAARPPYSTAGASASPLGGFDT
ncbi:MAG TPA: PRC-barrel domain-containing protein [Candidatus Limnocylindrales bacterium]|nr:PRC-barrel domain-containing protein [Candidatus Limnocylindrales bacterium]